MPDRGGRGTYGPALRNRAEELVHQARTRPRPAPGVQPHLVFRVPLAAGASSADLIELLGEVGITIVGIERDGAIIAFRDDLDLDAFRQALDEYIRGPRGGINPQTGRPYASTKAVRKNNFSNGAGAITDRTLEKQAFLIIPEGVAEVIFAHRLSGTSSSSSKPSRCDSGPGPTASATAWLRR